MLLASSGAAGPSFEIPEWGHGGFTAALLEAFAGEGGGELTVRGLAEWVGDRVAELTWDRQHPYISLLTEFPVGRPVLCVRP
jgi:hypothetical protein